MSIFDPVLHRLRPAVSDRKSRMGAQNAETRGFADIASHAFGSTPSVGAWAYGTKSVFRRNPVVYRCVRMIAEAAAAIPLQVQQDGVAMRVHPLMQLLQRPNERHSGMDLCDVLVSHLLLFGNAYLEPVYDATDTIVALYPLRPDRMRLACDKQGWPAHYDYQVGNHKKRFDATATPTALLHMTLIDPEDDHHGLSPLNAATLAVGIHEAANHWNKALFDNAARPSGALVYRGTDGQRLTDAQFDRLKQELQDNFQGAQNAGRPLLLEGGLDWASISMSPQDMDFIAAKHSAARDIALAFGVPPMLLGIPGDNAYANYAEANRAFWRQTVLPLHARWAAALAHLLCRDDGLTLLQNLDDVPALAEERRALWRRLEAAGFLSADEKRALAGYPPLEDDA